MDSAKDSPPTHGTILDSSGNAVVKPPDNINDFNLPAGTQALIETRLNGAVDQLREDNRNDLHRLAEEHSRKWRLIAYVSMGTTILGFAWGLFTWFVAPEMIRGWVADYVRLKVAEPTMRASLENAAQKEADVYVDTRLLPLRKSAESLKEQIDSLASGETAIQEQLKVQQWSMSARAGDSDAYVNLTRVADSNGPASDLAQLLKKDVEQYYDTDRYSFVQQTFSDPVTKQLYFFSVEEAFQFMSSSDSSSREAAANAIANLGRKSSVRSLCDVLSVEKNLRVISRITRALEIITKENFRPLDKEAVQAWWARNKGKPEYLFPNDAYQEAFKLISGNSPNAQEYSVLSSEEVARAANTQLRKVLDGEPAASESRFFLILSWLRLREYDNAEKELSSLEAGQNNYWLIPVARAAIMVGRDKLDDAIPQLSSFLEKYPTEGAVVRKFWIFLPLAKDTRLKWPVQGK